MRADGALTSAEGVRFRGIARYGRGARHHACTHGASELKAKDCLCSCPWLCEQSRQPGSSSSRKWQHVRTPPVWVGRVAVPPLFFLQQAQFFCVCLHQRCGVTDQKCSGVGGWGGVWKLSLSQCRFIADLFSTPMEGWLQLQVVDSRLSGGIRNITCMLKHRRSKSDKFYWDENNEFNLLQNNGSFSREKKPPDIYCIKLENRSSRSEYIKKKK